MRKVYRWAWHTPRSGSIMGIFTADDAEVEKAIGQEVGFGEVLGKHSDVHGTIERGEFEVVTDDAAFVEAFDKFGCATGYNPIVRLAEQADGM
jgi:hypothetical protein